MKALAAAYPDRISGVELKDADWAVQVDGEWFYWAHGRIVPEALRASWENYGRFRFYPYTPGIMPPVPQLDEQAAARLKKVLADARLHPPRRSEAFLERLFQAGSDAETERQIVTIEFLGHSVRVHQRIAPALEAVGAEIRQVSRSDPQAAAFLSGISEIDGFNYRNVAGTFTRSYHGYGLAVDLIPRSYGRKAPYWRWVMGSVDQWWALPYERRWMAPLSIVDAFEHHGFVWGGKWLFFDTMHFEYRPEIFILAQEPR